MLRHTILLLLLASTGCGSCAKQKTDEGSSENAENQQEQDRAANNRPLRNTPQIGRHPRGHINVEAGVFDDPPAPSASSH